MVLIKCPECSKEISDESRKCVHCGYRIRRKTLCPECSMQIEGNLNSCPKCGYKIYRKFNKKILVCVFCVMGLLLAIVVFFAKIHSLSIEEKAIKISIEELNIYDEEIMSCLLLNSGDEEYYIYFRTENDEYMTHVIDGIVESKCDSVTAITSGLAGNKAESEFIWSEYYGRDTWKNINHDTLKKIQ